MKSQTVKLPARLASALVNGDTSGLECSCVEVPPCRCGASDDLGHSDDCVHYTARLERRERAEDPNAQHTSRCDFRWLATALAYVAPGHIAGTACSCGEAEKPPKKRGECAPGCGEPYFSNSCPLPGWHLGADMLDFVVLYPD